MTLPCMCALLQLFFFVEICLDLNFSCVRCAKKNHACRRVQELAAERQRSAHAERALQEAQEAAKAEAEHLAAQLAEVREQLVVGASDEALSAHLSEFVAARTSLFEVVDAQEAELESLRGQVCCPNK